MEQTRTPERLRSYQWFGGEGLRAFSHRVPHPPARVSAPRSTSASRSSAILNTWSEINPCHVHLRERAEAVKRGVWQAGGFPVEMPGDARSARRSRSRPRCSTATCSRWRPRSCCGPTRSTARCCMGGCDKTTPALLMGAVERRPAGDLRAGRADAARPLARRDARQRQRHVEVLGRATRRATSTMPSGRARGGHRPLARPLHDDGYGVDDDLRRRGARHDAARRRLDPGRRLGARPDGGGERAPDRRDGVGRPAAVARSSRARPIEDAVTAVLALGGSTNAVIHLIAMAGRSGVAARPSTTSTRPRRTVPVLANVRPGGAVPDGGLLLRRRAAGAAWTALGAAAPRPADRPARRSARSSPAPRCTTTTSSARSTSRSRRRAGSRSCAATSPRTAR